MLGGNFIEELKKNKVLSNKSNKFAKLFIKGFTGEKELTIYGNTYLSYGYLKIETTNAVTLKVYYKDVLLSCVTGDKGVTIPIAIENNSKIKLVGNCDNLKVYLFGAKFYNENCNYLIPLKNMKVENAGNWFVRSYKDKTSFINGNFNNIASYKKLYSSQVVKLGDAIYHANLYENNGLYLCTDINNYNTNILIDTDVKSAIIMASDLEKIYIVYIKNNQLLYKCVSKDLTVSESNMIYQNLNYFPIGFAPIEVYGFKHNIVSIKWNNGSGSVFEILDDNFVNLLTFKGNIYKIQLFENEMIIVKIDDYGVSINQYNFHDSGVTLDNMKSSYKINVNDYYLIENSGLYFNNENCTEVSD